MKTHTFPEPYRITSGRTGKEGANIMKSKRKATADTKKGKAGGADSNSKKRLKRKAYDKELARLHGELVALQDWVVQKGLKVCHRHEIRPLVRGAVGRQ
ncbi:MAG: hypothetical protein EHM71_13245, partial [Zetaproteobacteria bacterium]